MEEGQDDIKRACGGRKRSGKPQNTPPPFLSLCSTVDITNSLSKLLPAEVDFLSFLSVSLSLPCLFLLILATIRFSSSPVLPLLEMNTWPQDQRQTPTGRPATLSLRRGALDPGARPGAAHGWGTRHADGAPGGGLRTLHPHALLFGGQWLMYPSEALPVTAMILTALLLIFCGVFFVLFLKLVFLTVECFTSCLHVVTHCSSSSFSSSSLFSSVPCSLFSQGADSSQRSLRRSAGFREKKVAEVNISPSQPELRLRAREEPTQSLGSLSTSLAFHYRPCSNI